MASTQIIRPQAVWALTGLSRSSIYRLEAQGRFPKRIKIGDHASGYLQAEVEAWVEARVSDRNAGQGR